MRKTANYQLNQWDPEDRILREEFNGDNEKLDEILMELRDAMPYVKLLDILVEESTEQFDIDIRHIDFTPYRRFELDAKTTADSRTLKLQVNGRTDGYIYHNSSNGNGLSCNYLAEAGGTHLCVLSRRIEGKRIGGMNPWWSEYGFENRYFAAPITWDQLATINLRSGSGGLIPAGSRFLLYGVKES